VALVDFGGATLRGEAPPAGRIAMTYFLEPEHASAPSEAGEQYAVAALLYLLLTGSHYLDFRYDRDEMLRQIECDPPRPFAALGAAPWPEIEEILLRALEKDPSRRHESMAAMAARLAAVHDAAAQAALATPIGGEATALLESTLQSFAPGGAMFASRYPTAPTASIANGCAGAAVALLRIAEARGDAALLALASVWSSRASALIGTGGAFYDDADHARDDIGDVTPYHAESGIHAAKAMIAAAYGDAGRQELAIASFLAASSKPCAQLDLTLGRSGSLLAASLLLAGMPDAAVLRAFGTAMMNAIWDELDVRPPIADSPDACLGLAHGWAGYLYAAMRWCAISGDPLPPRLAERLHEWAALKTPLGRGAFWRCYTRDDETWSPLAASWCNGSAGQLFLCTQAHRTFGDDEWLRLAEACAWTAWDEGRAIGHLCCGAAGRAYALLNLYKHTGAAEWLGRARQLANDAAAVASTAERANGLWKGQLGVAVLIADLASPESARMPFFE